MKILRSPLPLAVLVALCASLASCADAPSRPYDSAAQEAPRRGGAGVSADPGAPRPALTIQAGEGENCICPGSSGMSGIG